MLQQKGYKVVEFADSPPLALDGDVAYEADQVLPELAAWPKARADTHATQKPYLWIDKTGKAELFYFYDTVSPPDKSLFEKAVKIWSERTCIKFTKMKDRPCKSPASHGAVCVGNLGGGCCWSGVGNLFTLNNGFFQKTSVEGCDLYANAHEFGHSIGFAHYMKRHDRDQFITVNYRNFMVDLFLGDASTNARWKGAWMQGKKCNKGDSYQTSIPLPYDYLSIMGYSEADGGDGDYKVIFVAKDPRHQYMLDYKRHSGITTTHFDKYLTNLMYRCDETWAQSCRASGISPPKCKHYGYLQQNCQCACQVGMKGSACEQNVLGTLFPPLERAKTLVEFPGPGLFTLKDYSRMHSSLSPVLNRDFQYTQYATIVLKANDEKTLASVRVFEPGEVSQHQGLKNNVNTFIKEINKRDCTIGMRLYWGDFPSGLVRTECFSTFVNNEPEVNAVMLRARAHTMGIVLIGKQGNLLQSADFTKWMLEMLQFQVSFPRNARTGTKVLPANDGSDATPTPTANNGSGSAVIGNDSTAAAILTLKGSGLAWVALVLLGLLCLVIPLLVKRTKRKQTGEEESATSLDSLSESGSDTASSDDADSH